MGEQRKFWALALIVNKYPNIVLCPTLFQTREGSKAHEKITRHKDVHITPQITPAQKMTNKTQHGRVRVQASPHTPSSKERHVKTHEGMLTLFPTLCLQKSPPGPEWCQPQPLWACLWPCSLCGGKTEIFFNKGNHTLISLSYKIISPGNALKVS